jgi:penicillin amidase
VSPAKESCDDVLSAALRDARSGLSAAYGPDADKWRWGDSHRAHFSHPVFRNVPLLNAWLDADLPTDGDFFTIDRGTSPPPRQGVALSHIHGPGVRFLLDFKDPDKALFGLAGGESGNPLSPHYADWLNDWRDGLYRPLVGGAREQLVLQPENAH